MEWFNSSYVINVTSEQVREFTNAHDEREYVFIDVRQEEEYAQGHIAGAQLMPLNVLESYVDQLKQIADRALIFYCRSGARSARASAWALQSLSLPTVANLLGGFLGWEGPGLVDFPKLMSFDLGGTAEELLRQALELEKGTYRLYTLLGAQYADGIIAEVTANLVEAELNHGRAVYELLRQVSSTELDEYDTLFESLPGEIIENGISLGIVMGQARELGTLGVRALLELMLEIELSANDLYKNLSLKVFADDARKAISELAQQERSHFEYVLRVIGTLATL